MPVCDPIPLNLCIEAHTESDGCLETFGWLHCGYMAGHSDQYVSLKWKGMHSGLLRDYECEEPVLEIFSDADWAAD